MNWWVCVGKGIGVYFGVFLSGRSIPRGRDGGVVGNVSKNYLLTDWEG